MSWFIFSLIALLMWSGSDIFSKIGCRDSSDNNSHLKMVFAVGTVMGIHAFYEIIFGNAVINAKIILTYLPVSLLYIASMTIGYLGLKYIELSISSPICNSSGAIVFILSVFFFGTNEINTLQLFAAGIVSLGVIGLGAVEMSENPESRQLRQEESGFFYKKSFKAILIPVLYCILDALGTFADAAVLEKGLDETSANTAYEITFFVCGIIAFIIAKIKGAKFTVKQEAPKFLGAVFETVGQFFYINALADTSHVAISAPIISSYCLFSVLLSRIFLKEKLTIKHYIMIIAATCGIAILGLFD